MGKQLSAALVGLLVVLGSSCTLSQSASAAPAKAAQSKPANSPESKAAPEKPAATNPNQKLHRADFQVDGASCVACLRRVGKLMREQKGVLKADVSIFKPYWAIVIYDADQINMDKITESVKTENVHFKEIEDKPIASMPMIVIPKSNPSSATASGAPSGSTAQN